MTHPKNGKKTQTRIREINVLILEKSFEIKKDFLLFCFCLIPVLAVSDGVLNFNP